MAQLQIAVADYTRRAVPAQYDKNFFDQEFNNVARAIPPRGTLPVVTTSRTQNQTDDLVLFNPASGAISYTLLDPSRALNAVVTLKQITSNAHAVTIVGTVDGSANPTLGGINKSITIQSDGAFWWIIAAV